MTMKEQVAHYGKYAAAGAVGVGLGVGGFNVADEGPSKVDYQNLQEEVSALEEDKENLEDRVSNLQTTVDNRDERVQVLERAMEEREKVVEDLKRENANLEDAVAQAREREGLVDYLPVMADEDVELEASEARVDVATSDGSTMRVVTDSGSDGHYSGATTNVEGDYEGEEMDEAYVYYNHDDGHEYHAIVRNFEDSEDAEEYEEEVQQVVDNQDYDEVLNEDAKVHRDGDTVVYVYGNADATEPGYDFSEVASQY